MTYIFSGDSPTELYLEALEEILKNGDDVSPRGKRILEIRPAVFEFTNPRNRVTFAKGRVINPFFQLAESLWILGGKSDVASLLPYNSNMAQFSDNGIDFHAPYGERLRSWNKCNAEGFVFNPLDQLVDVYKKIQADKDTRQAVAVIYNPLFDNNFIETKDRPCNMILTFKVRKNKLEMVVFNRSNDLHWGLFGANLCQFSTIQEVMASWLGIEAGTYTHFTDSLHVYLEDYGSDISKEITDCEQWDVPAIGNPRISSSFEEFHRLLSYFETDINPLIRNIKQLDGAESILRAVSKVRDPYLVTTFLAMAAYRAYNLSLFEPMREFLDALPHGQWRISCLRFLSSKYGKFNESSHSPKLTNFDQDFLNLFSSYPEEVKDYIMRTDIKA